MAQIRTSEALPIQDPHPVAHPGRILDLSIALSSATAPPEVTDAVMRGATTAFPDSVGAIIARRSADEGELEIFAVSELPGQVFEAWQRFSIDTDAPLAEVVRTGQALALDSPELWSARYPRLVSLLDETGHRAQLVVPLVAGGVTTGALGIAFDKPRPFTAEDIQIATAIAVQCGIALERVQLFDREREAREAAEAANRTKSEFLANLSHELRTPINAISGYAQLLEMGVHGPITPEQKETLSRIQSIKRHMNGLIDAVLEFSRIEAGVVQYEIGRVDLEACIRECENIISPQMSARDLTYQRNGTIPRVSVVADAEKVRQVLVNVLSNAIKYTEPHGSVSLTADADDGCVYVRISDTGRGIDPSQIDAIFQPFIRLASTGSIRDGVGLGLPISRSLARGMGGDLTAEARAGGGSTFVLSLPIADD